MTGRHTAPGSTSVTARFGPYWKAVLAFLAPGAVLIGSAVLDSSDGGSVITTAEWITAAVACIVAAGTVYAVPNTSAGAGDPENANAGVLEDDAGADDLGDELFGDDGQDGGREGPGR